MQVLVIGAGVVGLAIGRDAALAGHDVIIAEAEAHIGSGTSSRNSEVIHAGIYYPTGSLRERYCARSRRLLYAYCASHGVPHRKLGKLVVVGKDADRPALEKLYAQAMHNGVEGLRMLEGAEAMRMEPALACVAAFHSPETGIIDSHRYMLALQGDLEDRGGMLALNTPVERRRRCPAAGRSGSAAASRGRSPSMPSSIPPGTAPRRWRERPRAIRRSACRSSCSPRAITSPTRKAGLHPADLSRAGAGGLGVHVTLDLAGRMRFGPDVEWIDDYDYAVDPRRGETFYKPIRSYWPALPDNSLVADYAGIRPKLTGPGEPAADFIVDTPAEHGLARLVHLFGIESPASPPRCRSPSTWWRASGPDATDIMRGVDQSMQRNSLKTTPCKVETRYERTSRAA